MSELEFKEWLNLKDGINFQIQMPNEIFEDFNNADFKNYKHKCFSYAYYYICSYLYRTVAYKNPLNYRQEDIMGVLATNHHRLSYITKKNGLLENIGYVETTSDYPINIIPFRYRNKNGEVIEDEKLFEFESISMVDKQMFDNIPKASNNYFIKVPIKGLKRYEEDDEFSGTFYNADNTHFVSVELFVKIIVSIGSVGLFIYAYLSMMYDRFKQGYKVSAKELSEVVGCSERTIKTYIKKLEEIKVISSVRHVYEKFEYEKIYKVHDKYDWRK